MTIRSVVALVICLIAPPVSVLAQEPPLPIPPMAGAPTPAPPMVDIAMPMAQTPAPAPQPPAQPPPTPGPSGKGPRGTPPAQPGPAGGVQTLPTPQQPPVRKIRGREVNVQVEITITEQQGAGPAEKRVVSMIVADAAFGRIRSTTANNDIRLNVDATPTVLDNDRITLELTVEYAPIIPEGGARRPALLLEMLTVILQNGKPMLLSQAADPTMDRRITLEVRAAVMK